MERLIHHQKTYYLKVFLELPAVSRGLKILFFLIWNDIEICEITHGKKITVNPLTGIEENFLRVLILGPAFGILLHQRGRLVLHASTVNINGGAVAFMGFNGGGKSTTTAALNNKGYPLVCDDISSVEFDENGTPVVFPGVSKDQIMA